MYSAPAVTPVRAGAAQKNALFYSVAGVACIIIVVFLTIALIVVALIPIYISDRSTKVDETLSKEVSIVVPIDRISSRRRRQSDELDNYIGSVAGPSIIARLEKLIKAQMDSTIISRFTITQLILAYKDDGRRKRRSLTKRAARIRVFFIKCRFGYQLGRSNQDRINAGASIRDRINRTFDSNITFTNVDFYRGGVLVVLTSGIRLYRPTYVGEIVPETSSNTVGSTPTTGHSTLTTTSTTTTTTTSAGVPFILTPVVPG